MSPTRPFVRAAAVLLGAGLLAGCGTLLEGNQQAFTVATSPPGAACVLERDGDRVGIVMETPAVVPLEKSKHDLVVTCRKRGYQTMAERVRPHYVDTTYYNFIFPGPIGFAWDGAASSILEYPAGISIPLAPTSTYVARTAPYHPGARSTFTIPFVEATP